MKLGLLRVGVLLCCTAAVLATGCASSVSARFAPKAVFEEQPEVLVEASKMAVHQIGGRILGDGQEPGLGGLPSRFVILAGFDLGEPFGVLELGIEILPSTSRVQMDRVTHWEVRAYAQTPPGARQGEEWSALVSDTETKFMEKLHHNVRAARNRAGVGYDDIRNRR
jgi:hypothetical protein